MKALRTIGTKELDEFMEVLRIGGEKSQQLAALGAGSSALVNATAEEGQLDAALETGLTAGAVIQTEYEQILARFVRAAENCMGERRLFAESPAHFFERISRMSAAEILSTMRRNGILVKGISYV